ncbi:MAG: type II/IV secretion system protein [Candidatus Berkelbacteria bacterium]|nr:type II/IV secretion system protein [Candidatus Berkelbacteria bacterium]
MQKKIIRKEDLAEVKSKGKSAEEVYQFLSSRGDIPDEPLAEALASAVEVPYVRLESLDPKALRLIDSQLAKRFGFIPFDFDQKAKVLQVALTSAEKIGSVNEAALRSLERKLGVKIELNITSKSALERLARSYAQKSALAGVARNISEVESRVKQATVSPDSIDLSDLSISPEALRKLPYELCEKLKVVVFKSRGEKDFDLAAAFPSEPKLLEVLESIEKKTDITFRVFKADLGQIENVLANYRVVLEKLSEQKRMEVEAKRASLAPSGAEKEQAGQPKGEGGESQETKAKIESMEEPDLVKFLSKEKVTTSDLKAYANADNIPQLMAGVIMMATAERASDIHVEPFEKMVRVRYRVDGELSDVLMLPAEMTSSIVARIKILGKMKIDEQRVPQDGRFDVKVKDALTDIRVATLPTVFGEKIVMRLLSKTKELEKLEDLGLDGPTYDRVIEAMSKPYGVILSTGPTGSGKSTTLYSIIFQLNHPEVNIVTLEDPVEYEIQGINQVQIKPQIGFGFADGLRSILRQDPNIIMVGEIRDKDTAELATQAALTGHLVLSTLHTNTAAGALPRLYNLGVEPFLITSATNAVIGQRLVRKLCPNCKQETEVPQSVVFETKKEFEKINLGHQIKFYKGRGCDNCKNGFKGRIGIFEVLPMSDEIANLVISKRSENEIFTQAVKEGMITMRQDGLIKAVKGLTSVDEVFRVTTDVREGGEGG